MTALPRALRLIICSFASTGCVLAAGPLFETTCVFPITPENKPNYRIPSILQAPNGDILIFAEKRNDGPGDSTIYSDDHGRTWKAGEIAMPDTTTTPNASETVIVQLADGRVMLNARTHCTQHRRAVTTSADGATGWSAARLDEALLEPVCTASIVRLFSKLGTDRNRIIFANPHNLEPVGRNKRRNLSIKLSHDEGETWAVNKALEPGNSAYSDLAVLPDGTILCFYERGGETDDDPGTHDQYCFLTLARFNLEWLTDGQDSLE